MADWPNTGDTDWNTKMKANIDVGHDSDGTHKKTQMLTDMGWSPEDWTNDGGGDGRESMTFPNGIIMKVGAEAGVGADSTVAITFDTAFPNGAVCCVLTHESAINTTDTGKLSFSSHTVTGFNINNGLGTNTSVNWIAIGY